MNGRTCGRVVTTLSVATGLALYATAVSAQDAGLTWENATELSFVSTGGNSSANTLGVTTALTGTSGQNAFKLEFGAVRGETSKTVYTGTPASFSEADESQLTAESYFARGRLDRDLGEAYLFAGAGWERNTFSGIDNRYAGVAGVGRTWFDGESGKFKTDIGATYTVQKDVDPIPGKDEGFGGARLSIDAMRRLSGSAVYTSVLVVNENLEDTEDLRADWVNALTLSLSESLAFKTSLQLLYDRQPALLSVPLGDGAGVPTGLRASTPAEEVDNILTFTLVITL
jgi:putative salt-induced outer membrane protein YdiY